MTTQEKHHSLKALKRVYFGFYQIVIPNVYVLNQRLADGLDLMAKCQTLYLSLPPSNVKAEVKEVIHAMSSFLAANHGVSETSNRDESMTALLHSLPSSPRKQLAPLSSSLPVLQAKGGLKVSANKVSPIRTSRIPLSKNLPMAGKPTIRRVQLDPLPMLTRSGVSEELPIVRRKTLID